MSGLCPLSRTSRSLAFHFCVACALTSPILSISVFTTITLDTRGGEYPRITFDTEDAGEAVFDELARRLPPQLYWSDLLPLTWETVGDAGVRQLATLVSEAYGHAKFASLLWSATDDDATRRYDWDSTFGIFIAPRALRALAITHEVVRDLEMYAHLE